MRKKVKQKQSVFLYNVVLKTRANFQQIHYGIDLELEEVKKIILENFLFSNFSKNGILVEYPGWELFLEPLFHILFNKYIAKELF
jgi:hypothetical protein